MSDVVTRGEVPRQIRENMLLWVGCVAGALDENEYRQKLEAAGFEAIDIEPTRVYRAEDARAMLEERGIDVDAMTTQVEGKFMSAFIRATKPEPLANGCCGGPAKADVAACCALDEEKKAQGEAGCGCSASQR